MVAARHLARTRRVRERGVFTAKVAAEGPLNCIGWSFRGSALFLPKRTYTDKLTIGSGKDRVELYYFGRGHTNGDTWIVFPSVRAMQTGDMFAWKDAPGIDRGSGGSGLDYAATVGRALATVHDGDTLIVGHSPLRQLAELKEYQQFMTDFVNAIKAARQAGKRSRKRPLRLTSARNTRTTRRSGIERPSRRFTTS